MSAGVDFELRCVGGEWTIRLGGVDITEAVKAVRVDRGLMPEISLDLGIRVVNGMTYSGRPHFVVDLDTAAAVALGALGWTPPPGGIR